MRHAILIVAGTTGAQLATEFVAGNVDQSAFERGRFVLVVLDGSESAVVHVALQLVERGFHTVEFVIGEQSRTAERTGMCAGTGDIVVGKTPIELGGLGELGQCGGGAGGEAAAPQRQMFVIAFSHGSYLSWERGNHADMFHHAVSVGSTVIEAPPSDPYRGGLAGLTHMPWDGGGCYSTVLSGTSMPLPNLTSRAAATRLGSP